MLRSLLVNRTIQKPSGSWEVRVPTSGVGIQLRGQLQMFTPGEGRREEGTEEERRQGRDRGNRERARVQMQQHRLNCCWLLILYVKLLIRM